MFLFCYAPPLLLACQNLLLVARDGFGSGKAAPCGGGEGDRGGTPSHAVAGLLEARQQLIRAKGEAATLPRLATTVLSSTTMGAQHELKDAQTEAVVASARADLNTYVPYACTLEPAR